MDHLVGGDGACIQLLAVFLDDLHHAGIRDQPGGHLHDHPAQGAQREDEPDDQPGISQVAADGQSAVDDHLRAEEKPGQDLESAEGVADRPEEGMHFHQCLALGKFQGILFFELVDLEFLPGISLHHADAGQVLLDGGGEHGFLFLVGFVGLGDAREENDRCDQNERNNDDRKQCQPGVQAVEGSEIDHKEQHNTPDIDGLVGEEAPDGIHIRGAALDQFTGRGLGMVFEGQPLKMVKEVIAQPAGDPFSRAGGKRSADEGGRAFEKGEQDESESSQRNEVVFAGGKDIIDEIAQEQVGERLGRGADPQGDIGADVLQAESAHEPPEPQQAV